MVDQVVASEDVYVFGQPSSIDVNISTGPQGARGTYIFQGAGKPYGKSDSSFLDNADGSQKSLQLKDMYINIQPSDDEYLYLYQYELSITGNPAWVKTLRLVPNTAIGNIDVIFYNGSAVDIKTDIGYIASPVGTWTINYIMANINAILPTIIPSPTAPSSPVPHMFWLDISTTPNPTLKIYPESGTTWRTVATVSNGLTFSLNKYFPSLLSSIGAGTISASTFNIQYSIIEPNTIDELGEIIVNTNPNAMFSTISVGKINTSGDTVALPIYITALKGSGSPLAMSAVTGVKKLHLLITAGVGA